jgi:superfamily II DNA or RNA helicase
MSSADEDSRSGSPSSDDIIISSTATTRNKRLRRLKRREARSKGSDMDSDFSLETKGSRFSTRQRKTLRSNLRERYEGDISENEELHKTQKFFGAKELFYKVPLDDEFRLRHSETCEACYRSGDDYAKGPLVFCQGCTSAYHQACLGPRATREHLVTKVADDLFVLQCRRCLGVARAKDAICPHQGCCTVCNIKGTISEPLRERLSPKQEQQLRQENEGKDPVANVDMARMNNADNLLFRCTACHRAFHFEHLIPESEATFQCQDCASAPGEISAMIAWRPRDPKTYVTGYTADIIEEIDKEYLIKWKGMSYNHTTWMPGSWVWGVVSPIMRRAFFKSNKSLNPHMTAEEAIPEDFLRADIVFDVKYADEGNDDSSVDRSLETDMSRVDRVTKAYIKYKGLAYEDAVWDSPPDRDKTERWADFQAAYEDWVKRDYTYMPDQQSLKKHLDQVRKQNFKSSIVKDTQPETLTGGQLMDYQKDGLNWLYYMWFKQQNAILADEMGLGKTIQIIGLFATLIQYHKCWPFLVVVPNSTCPNWRKEIKAWAPSIRVVTYYGSSFARQLAHKYEMFNEGSRDLRCHVVVTSYETMSDDASRRVLAKIPWAGLVVDEGQRLKNDKSRLYESLSRIRFPSKILLTGTPLQNNIRELFNLLQFCDPTKNAEKLENEYGVLSKENIPELHDMIRPFFLRRTKTQVLNLLPPVVQIIVPVSMSVVQKKLYKSILSKNPQLIKAIFQRNDKQGLKQTERHNLNNILMQLRKCLCHPFIYSQAIEERIANAAVSHRHLVEAAGKLQLLDIMLPKLKERGHRVLIFSQFLDNLDVVEDFLDGLGLQHRRLDGRMTSLEKQKMIDQYNAEDSPYFAFLLSTRSGGVGINLATADTVIIMDPDFNPHQDMQALSRAHRIGQKNKVLVFQLMTRGSAEEKIMQIGKKKMVLDHVLIDRMVSEEDDGQDLESILRHGAQALFEDDDSGDIRYDSASVDKLLDRSQAETALSPDENAPESQFSFARVWANDNQNLSDLQDTEEAVPDSAVWEKILQEREEAAAEEARKAETFGRGKRKRATVDYASNTAADLSPVKTPRKQDAESDIEFKAGDVVVSESEAEVIPELEPEEIERPLKKAKGNVFPKCYRISRTIANGSCSASF